MFGSRGDDRMHGLSGNDRLLGFSGDDVLMGGTGTDSLYGGFGEDRLLGGTDNDYLNGGFGNDTLDGGIGNDLLDGGLGNDIYTLNIGDGRDQIVDCFGKNTIRFGDNISLENIHLERVGKSLVIQYSDNDKVTMNNAFNSSFFHRMFNRSEVSVEFSDASIMTLDELRELVPVHISGDRWSNRIYGADQKDIISGMGGNDRMYGLDGDDTLNGDEGRDTLYGGSGEDILEGGQDRDRLYGGNDSDMLSGGQGNDKLYGGSGDDILTGGTGNDFLSGEAGNDTYQFALGDGNDTIYNRDYTGLDQLVMAEGITLNDLIFERNRNDLTVSIAGESDSVTVSNWYRGDKYQLDSINVENYELTTEMVAQLVQAQTSMNASTNASGGSIPITNEDVVTRFMGV